MTSSSLSTYCIDVLAYPGIQILTRDPFDVLLQTSEVCLVTDDLSRTLLIHIFKEGLDRSGVRHLECRARVELYFFAESTVRSAAVHQARIDHVLRGPFLPYEVEILFRRLGQYVFVRTMFLVDRDLLQPAIGDLLRSHRSLLASMVHSSRGEGEPYLYTPRRAGGTSELVGGQGKKRDGWARRCACRCRSLANAAPMGGLHLEERGVHACAKNGKPSRGGSFLCTVM